jgi:6-pyruvoyltetrahydropterin/6-carboxytetrahydropterin synthase
MTEPLIFCSRRIEFDAGHRLLNHEGKCKHLHGHRYAAIFSCYAASNELDDVGRVIDFGKIKEMVGGWIDDHLDHKMILNSDDPLKFWMKQNGQVDAYYLMPPDANPTAENLAVLLLAVANTLLEDYGIQVRQVRLYETPNCYADALLPFAFSARTIEEEV